MTVIHRLTVAVLAFACLVALIVHAADRPLNVGLVPDGISRTTAQDKAPLIAYLVKSMGRDVNLVVTPTYNDTVGQFPGQTEVVRNEHCPHSAHLGNVSPGNLAFTFTISSSEHWQMSSFPMKQPRKRILLIDLGDTRRQTREKLLDEAGYEVSVREDYVEAESLAHEARFDLIVLALHVKRLAEASAYSERLRTLNPQLPILLLSDYDVYVPHGTLSPSVETGSPVELLQKIAGMLAGSIHIREIGNDDFVPPLAS